MRLAQGPTVHVTACRDRGHSTTASSVGPVVIPLVMAATTTANCGTTHSMLVHAPAGGRRLRTAACPAPSHLPSAPLQSLALSLQHRPGELCRTVQMENLVCAASIKVWQAVLLPSCIYRHSNGASNYYPLSVHSNILTCPAPLSWVSD
jgi:hypothetical protein